MHIIGAMRELHQRCDPLSAQSFASFSRLPGPVTPGGRAIAPLQHVVCAGGVALRWITASAALGCVRSWLVGRWNAQLVVSFIAESNVCGAVEGLRLILLCGPSICACFPPTASQQHRRYLTRAS